MKTRRQTKKQASVENISPLAKKNKKLRGQKQPSKSPEEDKPNKKIKKQRKSPTPERSPKQTKNRRGRKRKQERVLENSEEKSNEQNKKKENQKNKESGKKEVSDKQQQSDSKQNAKNIQKDVIKKVIVKGAAPVDQYFDRGKDFHVLVHEGKVYAATLNQTNIKNNNNKYYNLQIIQSDRDANTNYFMTRWGRVGTPGQKSIVGPFSIKIAINEYESKFREKHLKGQYRQLELNYGDEQKDEQKKDGEESNKNPMSDYQQSKLPKQTKDLINLIFDIGMMNRQMKQIGYNVNKMPLGKLSKQNIKKGYNMLKQLEEEISHKKRQDVMEQLTNDFYSYIPHDVGFKNMRLYKLDTRQKVKQKIQMLQSLAEIKIATQILDQKHQGNKIDNNYKKLNRQIKPIPQDSFTYKLLNDYLQTTHASTHQAYDLQLVDLFELQSQIQNERYTNDISNKMLLWHGSRLTNFVGILSQGLRIAPPEAPVTGYMFGKGVYFADMSSKSANYCFTSPDNNTGILILCEVALGNCNEKMHADYLASNLPEGKHSTKGVGKTAPKPQNYETLDEVIIPMGPGEQTNIAGSSLLYNEYIVYKIEQIRIRYLLRVKFNYRRMPLFS